MEAEAAAPTCMYPVQGNVFTAMRCPLHAAACIISAIECDVVATFNQTDLAIQPNLDVFDIPIASVEMLPANISHVSFRRNGIKHLGDLSLDASGRPSSTASLSLIDQDLHALTSQTRFPRTLRSLTLARSSVTAIKSTSFPPTLTSLDLSDNVLNDFVVDSTSFGVLSRIPSFGVNVTIQVAGSSCMSIPGARFESVQNGRFFLCVLRLMNDTEPSDASSANTMHDPTTIAPLPHSNTGDSPTGRSASSIFVTVALVSVIVVGVIVAAFYLLRRPTAMLPRVLTTSRTSRRLSASFLTHSPPKTTKRSSIIGAHDVRFDPSVACARLARSDLRSVHVLHADGLAVVSFGYWKVHAPVTIRQLQPNSPTDSIATFMDEARTCVLVVHEHIVTCLGVSWSTSSDVAIVSEHMEGGTLQTHMTQYGHTRQFHEAKWVVAFQVTDALVYLHAHGIVYRTLHAESVLLSADGHPKLSNYGLRRSQAKKGVGGGVSLVWAHLASTAPELLNGGDHSAASDVYALGVLLCQLDHGVPSSSSSYLDLNGDDTLRGDVERIVLGKYRPVVSSTCPDDIAALIQKCVQVNPRDRPTAEAVLLALQPYHHDVDGAVDV
ncbi:serine/threonine protein kinase [Aphanomyces invadans]|uniref:Serine/threonine protein kinase n=1 Tax=Aphanomyces invadans TaxID=157072 RepID=A0A024TM28_9STRA|nr:serine/threonine protein kinase [Aphanomyces invadans]ETV94372.1 serine/threonine protein kinase [Aphanomyces invadans]|eukprot:XP_008877134.1 serine/threonine protein kinase [Aphanomyces invadans]